MTHTARAWPPGGSEMADRVRRHDWAGTPLGPIDGWSERLKLAVEMALDSPAVSSLACGPDHILIYNDAAARLYGERHPAAFAQSLPATFPEGWRTVAPLYARAFGGAAVRVAEQPLDTRGEGGAVHDVFDAWLTPVRDENGHVVAVHMVGVEVSGRLNAEAALLASEERQSFLLRLTDALSLIEDATAVLGKASEMLAEKLGVDRAYYVAIDEPVGTAIVERDYVRGDGPSLAGRHPIASFAWSVAILRRNACHVVPDTRTSPLVPDGDRAAAAALQIIACMGAPLIKRGRLVGALCVTAAEARSWTGDEVNLLRDVAERVWTATERARADQILRDSEERQAFLLRFSDTLRAIADPLDIQQVATRVLGEQLRASRVFYVIVEEDGDTATIHGDYTDGVPSRTGRYALSRFSSSALADWRAGRVGSTDDVEADPRYDEAEREAYAGISTRAGFGVPLMKEGRLVAILGVNQSFPRHWTPQEIDLSRDVAERTWAAVERGRAEAAMRASEERFRQFGEASQDVLWIRDAETLQWQYLTPAFEQVYGASRHDALSGDNYRAWLDLIVPEDRPSVLAGIEQVRLGQRAAFEYRVTRPSDGAVRWLHNTDFPIRDQYGRIAMIGGIEHDLTELRETDLRLRALVSGIPQLVWRAVDGGSWTWASPQWTAFTGQAEASSYGWGWLSALHPDDHALARKAWRDAEEGGGMSVEYRLYSQQDRAYRWFQTRATPVRDASGTVIEWLGTSTDIQDLRVMQDRQQVMVTELQHRTRNLITVINALSKQTLSNAGSLADFGQRFGDRLSALSRVQGLLSHVSAGKRVAFDELLRSELSALGAPADKITLEGPEGVPLRSATVQTFALALHELATNALKYGALAASAGHLTIHWSLRQSEDSEPRLTVDWRESGVALPQGEEALAGGGYGRELIERALPYQLGADTTFRMTADGVHCTIDAPVSTALAAPSITVTTLPLDR